MANVMPSDILHEVLTVLRDAGTGKGSTRWFLTAYQILDRLPPHLRDQLIRERGMPGIGSGNHYASASVVADACEMLARRDKVRIEYLDPGGTQALVKGQWITPSYDVCGLYQYIASGDAE